MTIKNKKIQSGFTLIEILVVIGILTVLIAIALVAINPAKQIGQANDTKRASDVRAILDAINHYTVDPANGGALPTGLSAGACPVLTPCTISNDATVSPRVDICSLLVTKYMAGLPQDPNFNGGAPINCTGTYNARYVVGVGAAPDNRITVTALNIYTYKAAAIIVTR